MPGGADAGLRKGSDGNYPGEGNSDGNKEAGELQRKGQDEGRASPHLVTEDSSGKN